MAVESSNNKTGIIKVKAEINLVRKVEIVDAQISLPECLASDSSEICIPKASEKASAIAIINIPPTTTSLECVPEWSPTINPSVVITPDVKPKLKPVVKECLSLKIQYPSTHC